MQMHYLNAIMVHNNNNNIITTSETESRFIIINIFIQLHIFCQDHVNISILLFCAVHDSLHCMQKLL